VLRFGERQTKKKQQKRTCRLALARPGLHLLWGFSKGIWGIRGRFSLLLSSLWFSLSLELFNLAWICEDREPLGLSVFGLATLGLTLRIGEFFRAWTAPVAESVDRFNLG
jgi:hypothetical protein